MPEWIVLLISGSLVAAMLIGFFVINRQLNELHLSMNSRLDELLATTTKLARAEGFRAGQENHLEAVRKVTDALDHPK